MNNVLFYFLILLWQRGELRVHAFTSYVGEASSSSLTRIPVALPAKKPQRLTFASEGNYKVWREPADPKKHVDYMNCSLGGRRIKGPPDNLVPQWVYFVRAPTPKGSKVLLFHGLDQVHTFRAYLSKPPLGTTAWPTLNTGWYNSWYEKLPKGLTANRHRKRTLALLDEILRQWEHRTPSQIQESLSTSMYYEAETNEWLWEVRSRSRKERNNKRNTETNLHAKKRGLW